VPFNADSCDFNADSCDFNADLGFISIDFAGASMRTDTENDTLTPLWKQELKMPVGSALLTPPHCNAHF